MISRSLARAHARPTPIAAMTRPLRSRNGTATPHTPSSTSPLTSA